MNLHRISIVSGILALAIATVAIADIVAASFPTSVWDGSTSKRSNRTTHKTPDAEDYDRLSAELIAVQNTAWPDRAAQSITMGPSTAIDFSLGRTIAFTVTASTSPTFSNPPSYPFTVTMFITNGGTSITWPSSVTWTTSVAGGTINVTNTAAVVSLTGNQTAPTLRTSGWNKVILVSFDGGTVYYATAN